MLFSKASRAEPLLLLGFIWLVYGIDILLPMDLTRWGIIPRSPDGLKGILFAPFLHGNLIHILSNSLPLLVLSIFVRIHGRATFYRALIGITLLGGLGTWFFSSPAIVVGSSILIFGFWSYLMAYGWFRRSLLSIFIALVTVILYGSFAFSFLSLKQHISWAGHFWGAVAGIIMAYLEYGYGRRK